jgi:hypothetical protein
MGGAQPDGPFSRSDRELLTLAAARMSPASIASLMGGKWTAAKVDKRLAVLREMQDPDRVSSRQLEAVLDPANAARRVVSAKWAAKQSDRVAAKPKPRPIVIAHEAAVRLKPITPQIVRWTRPAAEAGASIDELAGYFDVDPQALAAALGRA